MTNEPPLPHPLAPWPTLAERESGLLPPPEHYEGIPNHMVAPLSRWLGDTALVTDRLAERVLSKLRVRCLTNWSPRVALRVLINSGLDGSFSTDRSLDRLSVLNALIGLNDEWTPGELLELDQILVDAGSVWEINWDFHGLYRRVEAPVVEAWQRARAAAEESGRPAAARYLTEAWQKTYGMHPEPTAGYGAAVKAVDAVAVPLVLPTVRNATVHRVRTELVKKQAEWCFVLGEAEGVQEGQGSVDVVATMLDRLLRGETERHGDERVNRPSTPEEAQAAVHLAAVLVQWFVSGAVQRREG